MSAETGFGGNGNPAKTEKHPDGGADLKCVTEGPFAGLRPEYLAVTPKTMAEGGHCMFRDLPEVSEPAAFDQMKGSISPEYIAELQAYQNFTTYHTALEGGPHGVIHASLGGEMNPTTSPNGSYTLSFHSSLVAVSYVLTNNYCNQDPLFFLHHGMVDFLWWQWQEKNSARLTDYNGVASHVGEDKAREVALDDILAMNGIEKDVTVRNVMDTRGSLCYTY